MRTGRVKILAVKTTSVVFERLEAGASVVFDVPQSEATPYIDCDVMSATPDDDGARTVVCTVSTRVLHRRDAPSFVSVAIKRCARPYAICGSDS